MGLGKRKNRLAYWRRVRGLSQDELGRLLRVAGRTVRNWELDVTTPTRDQGERIASLLRVNVRELFPFTIF
ncbi:MAG: Helix-turn-helix domain [Firmicutes bacterium]|nr:Helix-turn-helix domain [Bacillota bacterium]